MNAPDDINVLTNDMLRFRCDQRRYKAESRGSDENRGMPSD
jgi:hypothetical protein